MNPRRGGQAHGPPPDSRSANRLAAAVLAGCQDGRCVRTHGFAPARNPSLSDVACRIVVGVPNEVTPHTDKQRLGAPVFLVHVATSRPRARLGRVGRIDLHERDTRTPGLVFKVLAKLPERPRVHCGPLGLAKPYPSTDPRQPLDSDTAFGAFSLGHNAFADLMVQVSDESRLTAASFLEKASGRRGFLRLQPFAHPKLPVAVPVEASSGGAVTVARGGDIDDSKVHTQKAVHRHLARRLRLIDDGVQQQVSVTENQIGLTDLRRCQPGKIHGTAQKPHVAHASSDRPDGHRAAPARGMQLPRKTPRVKRLRCVVTESDRVGLDLATSDTTWSTIVARPYLGMEGGIGVCPRGLLFRRRQQSHLHHALYNDHRAIRAWHNRGGPAAVSSWARTSSLKYSRSGRLSGFCGLESQ